MKFLRHALNVAIWFNHLDENPFTRFQIPKVSQGRTRFLTLEEATLLKALGAPYDQWARLAILTGLRKLEMFGLRWAHVDMEQKFVTLPQTKSGKAQYVPLNEEARLILRNSHPGNFRPGSSRVKSRESLGQLQLLRPGVPAISERSKIGRGHLAYLAAYIRQPVGHERAER